MRYELDKHDNYVLFEVHSFMIEKFGLIGNELLVYALIYNQSRINSNMCTLSLKEMAACTGASIPTIVRVLKVLCDKKLIIKKTVVENKVTYCHYKATDEIVYVKKLGQNCTVLSRI